MSAVRASVRSLAVTQIARLALLALLACSSNAAAPRPDGAACASTPRQGCCFDDDDCTGGAFCAASTCEATHEGRCEMPAGAGACWSNGDCAGGTTCHDARICQCGSQCLLPDAPGSCQ